MSIIFRGGRLPFRPAAPRLELVPHLTRLTPKPAVTWKARAPKVGWGMLGNDQWGDCACAGAGHAVDLWGHASVSTALVLGLYSDVTGFIEDAGPPGENPTDRGTNLADLLGYWRKHPFAGQKILAYAHVNPQNTTAVKLGVELFGCAYIGVNLPASAMDQFNGGEPWTVLPGGSPIEGGHCVLVVGYDAHGVDVVTWGKVIRASWAWFTTYCDEAWVIVDPAWVAAEPEGVNRATLGTDFRALTGEPDPFGAGAASFLDES